MDTDANLTIIEPPAFAQRDIDQFKYWLKIFGRRLIDAGLGNVVLRPMVKQEDGGLIVAVESTLDLGAQIQKAAKATKLH